ncbi:unnamed protein product [Auanema sp. JU1783]|nr:unnamed protein product [Auanema sp. JU1783]
MSVSSTSAPTTSAKPELLKVVNNVWAGVREMLGINQLNCANGGERMAGGKCKCPRLFEGPTCERKVCLNDGELMKTKVGPVAYECKCPNPLYIDGPHCETVRCAHKALLVKSNDTWSCDCSSRIFYTGKFCENFTAPYSVLAVPIAFLIIFLLCCALCRIDWCPRKRRSQQITQARHGERRRPNPRSVQQPCRYNDRRTNLHQAQEFLLPSERQRLGLSHLARSSAPYPPPGGPPYIIRLDTIPTFNPNMIGGVDSDSVAKHIDPPPSYDQALLAPGPPEPPMYSENSDGNTSNQSNASPNRHTTSSSTRPTTNDSSNG